MVLEVQEEEIETVRTKKAILICVLCNVHYCVADCLIWLM